MARPNYVATKSAWAAVTFWRIVLSILIIPFIIMIVDIIAKKCYTIEFYDDYVIERSGILSKSQKRSAFLGVLGVSVNQSAWQRICGYGDVQVDVSGRWDVNTNDLANPVGLQRYLETKFVKGGKVTNVIAN